MHIDAERSLALPGSRTGVRNLHARLQRCLAEEAHTLVVAAVGNSMTHGTMNCKAAPPNRCAYINGSLATQHLRWANSLQEMLQQVLPCRVLVQVRSFGGAGSTYFSQPSHFGAFVRATDDVVIADWSVTDVRTRSCSRVSKVAALGRASSSISQHWRTMSTISVHCAAATALHACSWSVTTSSTPSQDGPTAAQWQPNFLPCMI